MTYYSQISQTDVTESEAIRQIIDICDRWYQLAEPEDSFDKYLSTHPQLLDIEQWPCFIKIEQENVKSS